MGALGRSFSRARLPTQRPPGDGPQVDLGRAVVHAERSELAQQAGDRQVRGHAQTPADLRRAVRDAVRAPHRRRPSRWRSPLEARPPSSSSRARDHQQGAGRGEVDLVVARSAVAPCRARRGGSRRPGARRRTRRRRPGLGARRRASASRGSSAPARAAPARGGTLGPTSPRTASSGTCDVRQGDARSAPEHRTVMVGTCRPTVTPGVSAVDQEHGGSAGAPGLARRPGHHDQEGGPSAPVIKVLRPLIRQPTVGALGARRQQRRVRTGARGRLGHREGRADLASGERARGSAPLGVGGRRASSRCTLPSSGAAALTASGPNNE